jgi:hypothetical protein
MSSPFWTWLENVYQGAVDLTSKEIEFIDQQYFEGNIAAAGISAIETYDKTIDVVSTGIETIDQNYLWGSLLAAGELGEKYHVGTRALGLVQAAGGTLGVVASMPFILVPEPVTTAGGTVVFVISADQAQAGFRQFWSGETEDTGLHYGAEQFALATGATPEQAQVFAGSVDFVGSLVGPGAWLKNLKHFKQLDKALDYARLQPTGFADFVQASIKNGRLDELLNLAKAGKLTPDELTKLAEEIRKLETEGVLTSPEAKRTLEKLERNDGVKVTKEGGKGEKGEVAEVPDKTGMLSPSELEGIERASPELLQAIERKNRTIKIAEPGSEEARFLDFFQAEANVGGENMDHIILKPNPSKAAVLEEFLHGTQHKLGVIDRLGQQGAEVHVKDFMIRHGKLLNLHPDDVEILKILRQRELDILKSQ